MRRDDDLLDRYRERTGSDQVDDLDLLLFHLRTSFADEYHGWQPVLGKNRYVRSAEAAGEIGGGGEGDPTPEDPGSAAGEIGGGGQGQPTPENRARFGANVDPNAGYWVTVAVLDTPFPPPAMNGEPYSPMAGHGTFVAGLVRQSAPAAKIRSYPVLDELGRTDAWTAAKKMMELIGDGVDIAVTAWTCRTDDGAEPLVLATAVNRLSYAGITVVAASGNVPDTGQRQALRKTPMWPAASNETVAVIPTDRAGSPACFSPDPNLPWIDAQALGVDVTSRYLDGPVRIPVRIPADEGATKDVQFGGYAKWSGSSFAAARYAGELAAT